MACWGKRVFLLAIPSGGSEMRRLLCALSLRVLLLYTVSTLSAATVDGIWNLVLNTEIGERRLPIQLSTEGEEVSAKLGDIPLKGSFRDGKLSLEAKDFYVEEAGFKADLIIEGTVNGNTIDGRWKFAEYSGPIKGERSTE
jgi:hypothetical protein